MKTFKDLLTESMKKHILQPAYTKTTENTTLTEGEVNISDHVYDVSHVYPPNSASIIYGWCLAYIPTQLC